MESFLFLLFFSPLFRTHTNAARTRVQSDRQVGAGGGVGGELEELFLLALLDDGVDVADVGDRLEDILAPVGPALLLGLLDHLVVVLHQGPTQPRLLVLPHRRATSKALALLRGTAGRTGIGDGGGWRAAACGGGRGQIGRAHV